MAQHPHDPYPKRVIWMQDEETLKWVLVGLTDDGEVQDTSYEDAQQIPAPPSSVSGRGRVWVRDEEGRWTNEVVDASKEELARADAEVRRRAAAALLYGPSVLSSSSSPQGDADRRAGSGYLPSRLQPRPHSDRERAGGAGRGTSAASVSSIHLKYAQRLLARTPNAICEEEPGQVDDGSGCADEEWGEEGVKYHLVKPSDTFQFICLKYKVSADALRSANGITGSTLKNAPRRIVIPSPKDATTTKKSAGLKEGGEKGKEATSWKGRHGDEHGSAKEPLADGGSASTPLAEAPLLSPQRQPLASETAAAAPRPPEITVPTKPAVLSTEEDAAEVQYHWVEKDDSLRWICLKYKVNANDLRRANNFTGSNLQLAPKRLVIPKAHTRTGGLSKKSAAPPGRFRRKATDSSGTSGGSAGRWSSAGTGVGRGEDDSVATNTSFFSTGSRGGGSAAKAIVAATAAGGADDDNLSTAESLASAAFGAASIASSSTRKGDYNLSMPDGLFREHGVEHGVEHTSPLASSLTMNAPVTMVHLPLSDYDSSDSDDSGTVSTQSRPAESRYHDVRPKDTIERLCMRYRVSAPALRRANIGLTGRNLQMGPKRLIIPPSDDRPGGALVGRLKNKDTRETQETGTITTHDDETNSLALSDGHSTLADQAALLLTGDIDAEEMVEEDSVHHDVRPGDTFQGICLRYGVSASELRRVNNIRGLNLNAAPERLVIPRPSRNGYSRELMTMTMTMTEDEKVEALLERVPKSRGRLKVPLFTREEVRAYLEFCDWNFDQALRKVRIEAELKSQRSRVAPSRSSRSATRA